MSSSLDFIRACDDDLVPAQEDGEGTIEHHPAEGWWWLSDGYGETDGFDGEARPHTRVYASSSATYMLRAVLRVSIEGDTLIIILFGRR
mgnify:CR=1 FL=1